MTLTSTGGTFQLFVTHNKSRSWATESTMTIDAGAPTGLKNFLISPEFSTDQLLVYQLDDGSAYFSTDAGKTFSQMPALIGGARLSLVPALPDLPTSLPGQSTTAHAAVLGAAGTGTPGENLSYLFDPIVPGIRLVTGTPDEDQAFFISPTYAQDQTAFASGVVGSEGVLHAELFSCTPTFTCGNKLASFDPSYSWVDQLEFAPDYASSGTLIATVAGMWPTPYRILVSHDRGAHFAPIATLDNAMAQIARYGSVDTVDISAGAPGSKELFAYINGGDPANRHAPPFDQLFRSVDDGKSWNRIAYNRCQCSANGPGTLPYGVLAASQYGRTTPEFLAARGNQMLLLSQVQRRNLPAVVTLWCSTDRGRSWRLSC